MVSSSQQPRNMCTRVQREKPAQLGATQHSGVHVSVCTRVSLLWAPLVWLCRMGASNTAPPATHVSPEPGQHLAQPQADLHMPLAHPDRGEIIFLLRRPQDWVSNLGRGGHKWCRGDPSPALSPVLCLEEPSAEQSKMRAGPAACYSAPRIFITKHVASISASVTRLRHLLVTTPGTPQLL